MLFLFIMAIIALILAILRLAMVIQNGEHVFSPILFVIVCLGLIIYSGINLPFWHASSRTTQAQTSSSSQTTAKSSKDFANTFSNAGASAFPDDAIKKKNAAQSIKENSILKSLKSNYTGTGTVSFSKAQKTYYVKPTNKKFVSSLKSLIKTPANAKKANFGQVVSNFKKLSLSIKKNLGSGYSVSLMNPNKPTSALLTTKDGTVTYNYFD
ncbi:hypothetical protein ACLJJ6_04175 [Pediococcus siamensis]|uniref:hypothetical protein n=1 Tax=Pediococcus siamensis TaxID=381829 RepID=UPI00399F213F